MTQNTEERIDFIMWEGLPYVVWKIYDQRKVISVLGKAANCIRMTVAIGNIRFDIKYGRSVH